MAYVVKTCFLTLQGEGAHTGRAAVFCRFIGCNLWSGLEENRSAAICKFCDTDFVKPYGSGGGRFASSKDLASHIASFWSGDGANGRYVVFTGGEPLLQLDPDLIRECHAHGFEIAIETNGTLKAPEGIDWICVSPKANAPFIQQQGNELKLVYPQQGFEPKQFEKLSFTHFFLQPMDSPQQVENVQLAVDYCQQNPKWRLSLQTHKMIGIP